MTNCQKSNNDKLDKNEHVHDFNKVQPDFM